MGRQIWNRNSPNPTDISFGVFSAEACISPGTGWLFSLRFRQPASVLASLVVYIAHWLKTKEVTFVQFQFNLMATVI